MRVIYIADDGTCFNDKYECEHYEWKIRHPHLKFVHMYDKNGDRLEDIFSIETYNTVYRVVIITLDAAIEMVDLAKYTGFCAYEDINRVGVWKWDEKSEGFRLAVGVEP